MSGRLQRQLLAGPGATSVCGSRPCPSAGRCVPTPGLPVVTGWAASHVSETWPPVCTNTYLGLPGRPSPRRATRGTYCLAEDDVPPEGEHQALGQAGREFLQEHEGQGLLGSVHHFSHAVLEGADEGTQLLVPVLCGEEGGVRRGTDARRGGRRPFAAPIKVSLLARIRSSCT